MKKVIVIGCPGAGKSTFAGKIRDMTGLPLYHLDMLWHKPDRTNISREEFDEKLSAVIMEPEWIIDGNYGRTLEMRMAACDTVFLLDYPLDVCLAGVEARIGKPRKDMPWVEEEFDEEFRQWILDFPEREMPHIRELIEKYRHAADVHIFNSRDDAEAWLENAKTKRMA